MGTTEQWVLSPWEKEPGYHKDIHGLSTSLEHNIICLIIVTRYVYCVAWFMWHRCHIQVNVVVVCGLYGASQGICSHHYDDVIMTMLASQITSLTVVYSIVYSGVNQRKHQSSASLAFVREIHRGPVNFPHKWPVTRKMFPFDDVIMMMTTVGQCMPEVSQRNEINDRWMYWSNLISKQLSTRPSRYCMMRVPSGTWTINHIPKTTVEYDYLSTTHLFGTTIHISNCGLKQSDGVMCRLKILYQQFFQGGSQRNQSKCAPVSLSQE